MRILRVIASMNPQHGGPSEGIRNSIKELDKLGVHNEVVTLDNPNSLFLHADSFIIHALGPCKGPWCYSSNLLPWLVSNIGRFDAIIIHGLWLYPSFATNKARQIYKTQILKQNCINYTVPKLFIMPHGMLDPYFQKLTVRKLKAIRNWGYWKWIESKVINRADGLLFTCNAELLLARQTFSPYRPKREVDIGYGIERPPTFNRAMQKEFEGLCPTIGSQSYILFLGRIHIKKGVDLLIKAYLSLVKKRVVLPKLVISGPGIESSYGQKMKRLVSNSPDLRHLVLFTGMLKGDAKWGAFYGCEAFILPSHQENFGIAVVEAMACSKPVLISNQINIWREIQDFGGGLVEKDTLEGTQNLLELWGKLSNNEKSSIGHRAGDLFEKKFTIAPAAARLLNAICV